MESVELPKKFEVWEIEKLKPYQKNPRTHSEDQIKQIANSIEEFGFTNPILVDSQAGIIAGHGRLMAANILGMKEVPVIVLDHLTPSQKRAYIIADNRLALNSGWDDTLLSEELKALELDGFDLSVLGFQDSELDELLDGEEDTGADGTSENEVPEVPKIPKTKLGQVFKLGDHRLLCGDSTNMSHVHNLMGGEKTDLVFTDPPYGMSYGGGRQPGNHVLDKNGIVKIKAHGMILNDDKVGADLIKLVQEAIQCGVTFKKPSAGVYVCFTWRTFSEFEKALIKSSLKPKACIVWNKKSIGLGMSHYRPQHEFIFYCDGEWLGGKDESDVWEMSRGNTSEYVHPTQKPVELIERAIRNSCKRDGIVLDLFGGSGSTLIAAEKTKRKARLMELDPKYCDVIIARWEKFTGQKAVLLMPGKTVPAPLVKKKK
ncbi:MAG: site-specific DNA-methyltransferase [Oligoflexia bacterium]|nr:site-specific DNA-methyltransferase [Oligoflexia bacterium]